MAPTFIFWQWRQKCSLLSTRGSVNAPSKMCAARYLAQSFLESVQSRVASNASMSEVGEVCFYILSDEARWWIGLATLNLTPYLCP